MGEWVGRGVAEGPGGGVGIVTYSWSTRPMKTEERTVCGKTGEELEPQERDWESGRLRA